MLMLAKNMFGPSEFDQDYLHWSVLIRLLRYKRNISELDNLAGNGNITLTYDHYKDGLTMLITCPEAV